MESLRVTLWHPNHRLKLNPRVPPRHEELDPNKQQASVLLAAWICPVEAVRVFQKLGYRVVRESGHLIMSNGERRLVIPRHDPINAITMGAIARDAGLTPQQFRELL